MDLNYNFPVIENIKAFREKLRDPTTFHEVDQGEYTVFNYNGLNPDNFPPIEKEEDKFIRECRGIAFLNSTGELISRPFHKFFNYGEREQTSYFPVQEPHRSFIKLDGSMIRSIPLEKGIRLGTKAGITDTSMFAENFACTEENIQDFLRDMWEIYDCTPIFEFTSRSNKIVIDYPEPRLTLLDIRQNIPGTYFDLETLQSISSDYSIPLVRSFEETFSTFDEMIKEVKSFDDKEGIVIRLDSGHRVKVKGDWYVKMHRYTDLLRSDRHFVRAYLSEEWDDIYSNADLILKPKLDHAKKIVEYDINYYAEDLISRIVRICKISNIDFFKCEKTREDRKNFAHAINNSKLQNKECGIAFKLFVDLQNDDPNQSVKNIAKQQIRMKLQQFSSKQKSWEEFGIDIIHHVFENEVNK